MEGKVLVLDPPSLVNHYLSLPRRIGNRLSQEIDRVNIDSFPNLPLCLLHREISSIESTAGVGMWIDT